MKKFASCLLALGFAISTAVNAFAACVSTADGSGIQSYTLLAGQTINTGQVTAQVNGNNLEVTYTTTDGWSLNEVHLWVGENIADMPQTRKGSPIPGKFPYVSGDITSATSYQIDIPLDSLGFACPGDDKTYLVAAHASVSKTLADGAVQSETGWSEGARFVERGNWATYSTLALTCDCDSNPPVTGSCETAFSYSPGEDATCFLDIDEDGDGVGDFNRWGWTIGPLSPGTYNEYDVYAGAGKCDTNKGTHVGTVRVDYDGTTATVSFLNVFYPYNLKETHVYVGNDILPSNNGYFTVAPGQYTEIHDDLGGAQADSYSIPATGDIYVVSHATVCGFE